MGAWVQSVRVYRVGVCRAGQVLCCAEALTVAAHKHCIGLGVRLDRCTQPVCQLTLARGVLNDGHNAVACKDT